MRLSDRVVIVTGGARGIGRAYCLGVAAEGARVVVADVADAKPTGAEIEARGAQALAVACDVSREADTQRPATEPARRLGHTAAPANVEARMLKRAQMPEDLVGTLVFLASDDSDFMSGQTMLVDGGGSVH